MIVICVYRSPSGDFNHFLRLLDMALLSLNKPSTEPQTKVITMIRCLQYDVHSGFSHKISKWSLFSNRQYFCGKIWNAVICDISIVKCIVWPWGSVHNIK